MLYRYEIPRIKKPRTKRTLTKALRMKINTYKAKYSQKAQDMRIVYGMLKEFTSLADSWHTCMRGYIAQKVSKAFAEIIEQFKTSNNKTVQEFWNKRIHTLGNSYSISTNKLRDLCREVESKAAQTRKPIYREAIRKKRDLEFHCAICIGHKHGQKIRATSCGHRFHSKCLKQWTRRAGTCPLCRAAIK